MAEEKGLVLLVEDNPHDEELALRALSKCSVPHVVALARDGKEAIAYLEGILQSTDGSTALPNLILLDLKLPKTNGHEVLRSIRARSETAQIPIVILTSSREAKDIDQSYALGANSYVRKPVGFSEFCEVAAEILEYWLVKNFRPPELQRDRA